MRIQGFKRRPNRCRQRLFDEMPPDMRWRAQGYLNKFCQRHKHRFAAERWLYPLLVGRARWFAKMSQEELSAWGRSSLSKRGGYATQARYRETGRVGMRHPAHRAALISASKRKLRGKERAEEHRRKTLGLPPKPRHKYLPLF